MNNDGAGGSRDVSEIIPLNRFSSYEEPGDKMLPPVKLQIHVELQDDDELIHMAQGTDAGRVVASRFNLWIPRITAKKDSLHDRYISPFLKRSKLKIFIYKLLANASFTVNAVVLYEEIVKMDKVGNEFVIV